MKKERDITVKFIKINGQHLLHNCVTDYSYISLSLTQFPSNLTFLPKSSNTPLPYLLPPANPPRYRYLSHR